MEKLVVIIMGQNCEKFIGMCLESVKDADAIVYCDGGSTDETQLKVVSKRGDAIIIENPYNQEDKGMNGKQRNFYLDYVKKNYSDWWCLCLDADEVVEGLNKIKDVIQTAPKDRVYSPKMRHLIGDLSHEDATHEEHFVLHRLFHIQDDLYYPEVEHPVLQSKTINKQSRLKGATIWHLSHIAEAFNMKQKYENHLKKSQMHTTEYLKEWYYAHLFGTYPTKQFNPVELPEVILNEFGIDKDELYFANRGLEVKHFIDAIHWKEFFKCKNAIEFGCGRGPRIYALNNISVECYGYDISKFAVNNKLHKNVYRNDVLDYDEESKCEEIDLSIAYDLLEHIKYEDLEKAINNLIKHSTKNILISVPFKGTPNYDNDPTQIIKEDRDWWIKKFTEKGLKLIPTPEHFLYKEQILIFEKCQ